MKDKPDGEGWPVVSVYIHGRLQIIGFNLYIVTNL